MRLLTRWRRRSAACALLLALLPAACAAPPAPAMPPPLPYPPSVRERMLHIAWAEWSDWGRIVVASDAPREGQPGLPGPESALSNFPRVLAYWRAVAEGAGPIARNRVLYAAALARPGLQVGLWQEPAWSAAFISFVMRTAGVDRREFPPSAAHAFYLDALLADAQRFPATAPFIPHDPADRAPEVGDLICADRSAQPLRHWQARLAEAGQFRPMHCDIVVTVAPGVVEAVGGNVADAVTLSRFPADMAGRLLARPANGPTWFAVLENRLGRLPPWNWRTAS
ncbi:DUF2272 domain-containing protein [Roseomonas sp. M0104]|uniref:DUF2272 domain-containing protein n=1 Tax=Teichococcus coralli TaxID=2545983 RepID=A0A845BR84_9PROT|nr:DUF2272 domain-containing protein [Pseudoroseomonas coralli]MXP65899.1 DUF2272 domain-containing protein [Pseudoroseomonas coralli]